MALSAADDGDFMSDSDSGDDRAFPSLQDDNICYHDVIAAVIASLLLGLQCSHGSVDTRHPQCAARQQTLHCCCRQRCGDGRQPAFQAGEGPLARRAAGVRSRALLPTEVTSPLLLPSAHCDREDTMRCSYLLCKHASNKAAAIVQACERRTGSDGN